MERYVVRTARTRASFDSQAEVETILPPAHASMPILEKGSVNANAEHEELDYDFDEEPPDTYDVSDPEDTEDELELVYEEESDEEIVAASGVDHDSQCSAEQSILAQNPDMEENFQQNHLKKR